VLGCIHRARRPHQLGAPDGLAHVRRTKVEAVTRRVDPDGVQIPSTQDFHPHDALLGGRDVLLHQRRVIDPQVERTGRRRLLELRRRLEAPAPPPPPPATLLLVPPPPPPPHPPARPGPVGRA